MQGEERLSLDIVCLHALYDYEVSASEITIQLADKRITKVISVYLGLYNQI